jgi:hypothetical protein
LPLGVELAIRVILESYERAGRKGRDEMKPRLSSLADTFAPLRDAASSAVRNLGLTCAPWQLSPEHWQRVLVAVEARARMRGYVLPFGWRDELAVQTGRSEPHACAKPESQW